MCNKGTVATWSTYIVTNVFAVVLGSKGRSEMVYLSTTLNPRCVGLQTGNGAQEAILLQRIPSNQLFVSRFYYYRLFVHHFLILFSYNSLKICLCTYVSVYKSRRQRKGLVKHFIFLSLLLCLLALSPTLLSFG